MAIFRTGNMWSCFDDTDFFVITTNSYLKNDGALVMGRGIAREVRDRFPGIDLEMGARVRAVCGHLGFYGFEPGKKLCLFQVKYDYRDLADLTLIRNSAASLGAYARGLYAHQFALNFPGIGNGGLGYDDVRPLLDVLPDNVHVWSFN